MNICYILNHPGSGGSEKYLETLSEKAIKDNNKVFFIFGEEGPFINVVKKMGISYQVIKMSKIWDISSAFKIRRYLINNDINIVHANFLREQSLAVIARILGSKASVVRTIHRADKFSRKVFLFMEVLNIFTGKIIAPAKFIKKTLDDNGIKNVLVISNGVNKVIVDNHTENIGYLGRVHAEKGIIDLVDYFSGSAYGYKLLIAGDGPDLEKVKNKKNVELLGRINNPSQLFSKIAVLVSPSPTEVMPLSYLEAFSAGVPVVCFDIEANKEIVNKNNGAIIKLGDYKEMLKVAKEIINNTETLERLSKQAQKDFKEKYTAEIMWRKTRAVYDSLV